MREIRYHIDQLQSWCESQHWEDGTALKSPMIYLKIIRPSDPATSSGPNAGAAASMTEPSTMPAH